MSIESIVEQTSHELQQALEQGESIEPILENWFLTNPQVIVQILFEQRVQHPIFANSVFNYTENLEAIVSPEELYTELGKQMQPHADAFMDVVLERHPTSLWLIDVSRQVEGGRMGYRHLVHKHRSHARDLPTWCLQYALRGAREGLVAFAEDTGNPIPASVLFRVNAESEGLRAAVGAFRRNPKSPVLEFLTATVGPDIENIVQNIVSELDADILPPILSWWMGTKPD